MKSKAASKSHTRKSKVRPSPRKSNRKQVEEKSAWLAAIVESSDDAIIGKTLDGIITSWNKGAENVYGYQAAEVIGKSISILIPPHLPDELPSLIDRLKRGESIDHYETIRLRKDGEQINVSLSCSPIKNKNGELIGASVIARDITDRKFAEEQIVSLSKFPGENPNPVLRISRRGILLYANQSSRSLLNLWKCEVGSQLPDELVEAALTVLQNGSSKEIEVNCEDKVYSISFTSIAGAGYVNGYARDVTESKRAIEQLIKSEERFRLLFENNRSVMMLIDPHSGAIRSANKAAAKFYGYSVAELCGMTINDINQLTAEEVYAERMLALKEQRDYFNFRHRLSNGEIRSVEVYSAPIKVEGNTVLFSIINDITERVRAEKKVIQLKRLYATLSQVNQMIVRIKDRAELFQTICDVAADFGEFTPAWVGILDEGSGEVRPVAAHGFDIQQWPFPIINIHRAEHNESLTSRAIRTSKVMTDENIQENEYLIRLGNVASYPYHATAVIPFRLRNKVIGMVALVSQEKGLFNDEDEIHLLDEMGLDISFALDNMENEKERRQAERQNIQMKRLYATLSQVNQTIVRTANRDELYQSICDVAVRFGEFSLAWIGVLNESNGDVHPVAAAGMEIENWPFQLVNIREGPVVNGLIASAIRTSQVTVSDDMQIDESMQSVHDLFRTYGYRASAAVPFQIRGKTIGVLNLISSEAGFFNNQAEVSLLEEMSLDISFALDNMENEQERKQTVEALRQSEEMYRGLFDHMKEGYAYCQMLFENGIAQDWIYCDTNEAFETLTGLRNAKGKRVSKIIPGIRETDPELFEIYSRVALTGKHEKFEMFVQSLQQWFSISIYSPRREFFVAIFDVITERKKTEEALKRGEHVLRLFVEHSPASIAMFDREMRYIVASQRYLIDYELPPQDLTGRSHYDVFPEIPERWKEVHRRCLAGAIEKAEADPFPRINGKLDWVRWEIHPWYEESGNIGGVILFSEVITERKQIQDELRQLNAELEQRVLQRTMELSQANRAKDEFLANMSHELRTPLNTVLGLSETLLEQRRGPLNEKQVQSIELISSSGQHLLGLINDILEVSKIEAGKLQLNPSAISLQELCESSLNFIKELAQKKQIVVSFNNETSITTFHADPQRLKQILINLLNNAVKFTTEQGQICLQVSTNAQEDRILFSVTDTGIGIATEDLKKLFTPFTQLDSSLSRQYAGTGLGLALVQKLTELHGGGIEVESTVGQGSRFTVILPLSHGVHQQASEMTVEATKFEPKVAFGLTTSKELGTILLAEDNLTNAEMVSEYLMARGYYVVSAANGEEVLEKATKFIPRLIVMDIQMPKMDGLEATRRLRSDPRFFSTPIIALTALAMPGDKERCLEAGVNEYLSKPVSLKLLVSIIERLTGSES